MGRPLVSIVLPIHNGSKYMRQSIDSCLNQTYDNFELIIVDDASTDETPRIIDSYRDQRVKCIRHEANLGLPSALNTGFAAAAGDYLTWTSDDNFYARETLEKMVAYLENERCSFVCCDFYRFKGDNLSDLKVIELPDNIALNVINNVGACFLYTREVKDVVGDYDPITVLAEDYDYWMRVSKKFPMHRLSEPLYYYREHEASLSLNFSRQSEIRIAAVLAGIKNEIMDEAFVRQDLMNIVINRALRQMKDKYFMGLPRIVRSVAFKRMGLPLLYKTQVAIRLSKKINAVLSDFQVGKVTFSEAKLSLKELINSG